MNAGENPSTPRTLRRCADQTHHHTADALRVVDAANADVAAEQNAPEVVYDGVARTRQELVGMFDELGRRRCGGGPLIKVNGALDRHEPNDFIGLALAALPEKDTALSLQDVLAEMGIRDMEGLRSFRRLVAIDAALAAIAWATAPTNREPAAATAFLGEIDDPLGRYC